MPGSCHIQLTDNATVEQAVQLLLKLSPEALLSFQLLFSSTKTYNYFTLKKMFKKYDFKLNTFRICRQELQNLLQYLKGNMFMNRKINISILNT